MASQQFPYANAGFKVVEAQPALPIGELEFPRPFWTFSQMIGFSLLNLPHETAKKEAKFDFIVDNFPFFKSTKTALYKSITKVLTTDYLFQKIKGYRESKSFSWTLVSRSRTINEIKAAFYKYGIERFKKGMRNSVLFDTFIKEKPTTIALQNVTNISKIPSKCYIKISDRKFNSTPRKLKTCDVNCSATAIVTIGQPIDIYKI